VIKHLAAALEAMVLEIQILQKPEQPLRLLLVQASLRMHGARLR
jgi:hypothetical protein